MFDGRNRALTATTSRRSAGSGAYRFLVADIGTQEGAFIAARSGWLGAAWLAVLTALSVLIEVTVATTFGVRPAFVLMAIYSVVAGLLAGLAWLIRARQPRWAIIVVLVLLTLSFLGQVLSLRPGATTLVTGCLIYVTIRSVRGAFKLAEFRRRLHTPESVNEIFE